MSNNYLNFSKEELLKVIKNLESRKKYGLIWDEEKTREVFEKDTQNSFPVLREVKSKEILNSSKYPINILIEGDNYHSLSVLSYTHQGKIDVIYADPPYNTGSNSWTYNNNYIDNEDVYRHSKWLSFMNKRLKLAKDLLKEDGVIVLTIDDYEIFTLGLLADEVFGEENRVGVLVMEINPRGRTTNKFFATSHEYILFYAKNIKLAYISNIPLTDIQAENFNLEDKVSKYRLLPFRRSGGLSTPEERPNSYYSIYYSDKSGIISLDKFKGATTINPIDSSGKKRVWRQTKPSLKEAIKRGDIVIKKNQDKYTVLMKDRIKEGRKPKTIWIDPSYDASSHGTNLLAKILGKRKAFDYPKSLYAVYNVLSILLQGRPNAVVLDFFAGSGTTGHAVLEMNKKENTNRRFILCTNNENGICEDVCYPRIKKVINGYKDQKNRTINGLNGNLKYFKTAFVKKTLSADSLKIRITRECTEMLCLREGIFDQYRKTDNYFIFKNDNSILGIYYSLDYKELRSIKDEFDKSSLKKIFYCFTLDPLGLDKKDFRDWKDVVFEPIPQKILEIYKRIYEY